jgi:hypothetical protein
MNQGLTWTEKKGLICMYYQCKHYTPLRIASLTCTDINEVKRVLRRNCPDYVYSEKLAGSKWRPNYGVCIGMNI